MSAVEKSDKKLIEPSDLGLACLSATAPSVFVKIRSPNDPPHRLGHPHGQKNLLRSPRLTFFSRLPNFDQNIKFIHSGVGSVVSCWDKKANNNFLCLRLAETGHWHTRTTSMKLWQEGHQQQQNQDFAWPWMKPGLLRVRRTLTRESVLSGCWVFWLRCKTDNCRKIDYFPGNDPVSPATNVPQIAQNWPLAPLQILRSPQWQVLGRVLVLTAVITS